ncbi:MAG TPA: NAD(P)-dependent oxidoreductase [Solirubrobacterales bacterium]|nr:NAD(P)-dependent oxidoreductase [Solirubrobacterales bacterium]
MRVAISGGAGYLGALTGAELRAAGHEVRVLDALIHDQRGVAEKLVAEGVEMIEGDVRDAGMQAALLSDADAFIHLAAIVGDPACARDPELAAEVNLDASRALFAAAGELGVERVVFASTCSNYGRMSDPTTPIDEGGVLAPISLYAEHKVEMEKLLLAADFGATCLRFATLYGVAPRMRFDLTVNEFTRELWADRELEIFGELFWRPYVHVADAARAIGIVIEAPRERVAGEVFNVGSTAENYRKLDLAKIISERVPRGEVSYVHRDEDPRDYKVGFEKIRDTLGFEPRMRVPDGVEEIAAALDDQRFDDPFASAYANVP